MSEQPDNRKSALTYRTIFLRKPPVKSPRSFHIDGEKAKIEFERNLRIYQRILEEELEKLEGKPDPLQSAYKDWLRSQNTSSKRLFLS